MTVLPAWPRPPRPADAPEAQIPQAVIHRLSWAGPQARAVWEPRLARLAEAALDIELAMVAAGDIGATLITATGAELSDFLAEAARRGLAAIPIEARTGIWEPSRNTAAPSDGTLVLVDILVSTAGRIEEAVDLLAGGDPAAIATLFGHPACCAAFRSRSLEAGFRDPLAPALDSRDGSRSASAHLLLAGLGIGPVRHAPCSTGCPATASAASAFLDLGRRLGREEEMGWLEETGRWNVSWSLAGGIAEVKTAIFRYAHRSDPGLEMAIRHDGGCNPEGAGPGLGFPFGPSPAATMPARPALPDPAALADALTGTDLAAGFRQGGFESPFAMRSRFCTVVWEQTPALRGDGGRILHLPCGDGLLLELATEVNARLVPHGIDRDTGLVDQARLRHPRHGGNFLAGDWSDPALLEELLGNGSCRIAFVDPEMLLDLASDRRTALLDRLAATCGSVVLVASDRGLGRFGDIDGLAASAGLTVAPGPRERVSARMDGFTSRPSGA